MTTPPDLLCECGHHYDQHFAMRGGGLFCNPMPGFACHCLGFKSVAPSLSPDLARVRRLAAEVEGLIERVKVDTFFNATEKAIIILGYIPVADLAAGAAAVCDRAERLLDLLRRAERYVYYAVSASPPNHVDEPYRDRPWEHPLYREICTALADAPAPDA